MPIIHVNIIKGRQPNKVEELIKNLSKTTSETLNVPTENIRVLVTEIPNTHWGKNGRSVSKN